MRTHSLVNLAPAQLRRAAEIKEQLDALSQELLTLLGPAVESEGPVGGGSGRRGGMSLEGRRRIAEAARARWAKVRASKLDSKSSANGRKRRKMSAASRKKMAEAAKARWARIRAAKG